MNITRRNLKRAKPEDVRRLARWLKMRDIDTMSDGQLIRLLMWVFGRTEKRRLGLTIR